MLNLLPCFKFLSILRKLLNQQFVLLLIVLNIAGEYFQFGLEGVVVELEFVELLAAVVGDVVENFALELGEGFIYVFWGDLFEEGGFAFAYFPEGFLLYLLGCVFELAYLLIGLHLQLFQPGQDLLTLILCKLLSRIARLPQPLFHILLIFESIQDP